jgi:hypothetical protein
MQHTDEQIDNLYILIADINAVPKLHLQHCLKATFIGFMTHFTNSMPTTLPTTTSKAPRANWNDTKITALIDYLVKHKAEMGMVETSRR